MAQGRFRDGNLESHLESEQVLDNVGSSTSVIFVGVNPLNSVAQFQLSVAQKPGRNIGSILCVL